MLFVLISARIRFGDNPSTGQLIRPDEILSNVQRMAFFVGAHPCGRWVWNTPFKPSPTRVGSYKDNPIRLVNTNMGYSNFIGPDQ